VAFLVYRPALDGGFVFDDRYLPFLANGAETWPLSLWLGRVRPVLMFGFWLQMRLLGLEPYSYHLVNFLLHAVNSALAFLILRRLLEKAAPGDARNLLLAGFGATLFLLHPLQTESVSYVASRSEVLSATFFLGAVAFFLLRLDRPASFRTAALALALFGAAVTTKEHTAVLPAVFLLGDYYWNPGFSLAGIRRNWRLYVPLALAALAGLAFIRYGLRISNSAGFRVPGVTWYEYFFTQCRVIWIYLRLYVLPLGQSIDPDVPLSRGLLDHGAVFGLAGLAALAAAAWLWRRREPLASFGLFWFLLLLAPTSSLVPIRDPLAERRMYLPVLGLILITLALARRWPAGRAALGGTMSLLLALAALATFQRNQVWTGSIPLWADATAKAPGKLRPRFQLAFAYYEAGRCEEAAREFETASRLAPPSHELLVDWGLALDCEGRYEEAVDRLERAAKLEATAHVYATLGMVHGKRGKTEPALRALAQAEKINRDYDMTYAYRGNVYLGANQLELAAAEFRRALALNPSNPMAAAGLELARQRMRAPR
jgi:tetratricopeptide (TPR) repeat protein